MPLAEMLFPAYRRRVLGLLLLHPDVTVLMDKAAASLSD
jgi:hypothetical protein